MMCVYRVINLCENDGGSARARAGNYSSKTVFSLSFEKKKTHTKRRSTRAHVE